LAPPAAQHRAAGAAAPAAGGAGADAGPAAVPPAWTDRTRFRAPGQLRRRPAAPAQLRPPPAPRGLLGHRQADHQRVEDLQESWTYAVDEKRCLYSGERGRGDYRYSRYFSRTFRNAARSS